MKTNVALPWSANACLKRLDYQSFYYENFAGIGIITLSRPPRNPLDHLFFTEFSVFIDTILSKENLRGLLIYGNGKHFSSGADTVELERLLAGLPSTPDFLLKNSRSFLLLEDAPYPTIAAIGGCCLGAGLELALACHYRIATPTAILSFPEAGFGLIPGCGGTVRSANLLEPGKAIDLVLGARYLDAAKALELGIIDALVPREDILDNAYNFLCRQDFE